jgi:hypothetical protein
VIVVFCDRPYVKDGPKARFYAGVPIITPSGINIGALCVLDDKPRDGLEPSQVEILRGMASTVFPGSFCNYRIVIHFSFGQESNRSVICNVFVSADGRPAKIDEGQAGHGWEISAFRFLKRHRNFRERLSVEHKLHYSINDSPCSIVQDPSCHIQKTEPRTEDFVKHPHGGAIYNAARRQSEEST